jgi:hypothetical protein
MGPARSVGSRIGTGSGRRARGGIVVSRVRSALQLVEL